MAATEEKAPRTSQIPDHVRGCVNIHEETVLPILTQPSYIEGIQNFEVRDSDIVVLTWPKSGTTWAQHLVNQIMREQEYNDNHQVLLSYVFMEYPTYPSLNFPFNRCVNPDTQREFLLLEAKSKDRIPQYQPAAEMPSPRFLMSHLQLKFLPTNLLTSGAKIVYVARNPKDAAVSLYNFCLMSRTMPTYANWDEYFDQFCKGLLPYDDWFEHVLTWWKQRDNPNVLFIKYEELKTDLKGTIAALGDFLGRGLSEAEINELCDKASFQGMKENDKVNPDKLMNAFKKPEGKHLSFMRKGIVGDWKNWFTVAQSERFDEIYRRKMEGSGLEMTFE